MPLIVLPKSCSCRCGPLRPPLAKKKDNSVPKGGMGGRHAATTHRDFKERGVMR